MKHFIFISVIIAISNAQFSTTEGPSQVIGVPGPRWRGPLANHILGQPVGDTPEVAAAKAAHYIAHEHILNIVPALPAEERYGAVDVPAPVQTTPQLVQLAKEITTSVLGETPEVAAARKAHLAAYAEIEKQLPKLKETTTVFPVVQQPQVVYQPQYVYQQPAVRAPVVPVQSTSNLIQLAEVIPRSELGETPEVAAARKAHLAAYAEIEKSLPKLEETTTVVPVAQPSQQFQIVNQQPQLVNQVPQFVYTPVETPEVEAARKAHLAAYAEIEKALPKLEETTTVFPVAQQPQQFQVLNQQPQLVNYVPQVVYTPGETPEVEAARKAHLAAYAEIEKSLPKLKETTTVFPVAQQPQQFQVLNQPQLVNQVPQVIYALGETPEVAAAREAHLAAYSKFEKLLKETTTDVPAVPDFNQQAQLWNEQLQRNLEWFNNPQQFYSYVPQDTPEVAAAKAEHIKLLNSLS